MPEESKELYKHLSWVYLIRETEYSINCSLRV